MSVRPDAPSPAHDSTSPSFSDADRLRTLLRLGGLSQREAARLVEVDDRTMRHWCAGKGTPPESVFRALDPALTHAEHLRRMIEKNEMQIAAMQDGRISGLGYGPGPSDPQSVPMETGRLQKRNEELRALLRLELAIHRRRLAFIELNPQWLPAGSGVPADESIAESEAAEEEFRAADAEVKRIGFEIRTGKR